MIGELLDQGDKNLRVKTLTVLEGDLSSAAQAKLRTRIAKTEASIQKVAGTMGPAGPQGEQGPQGIQGIQGIPGTDGAAGAAGLHGLLAVLTNEAHVVPADAAGAVSSYAGSGLSIQVFEGSTPLTFVTGTPAAGQFGIGTPVVSPAGKITVGARSGGGTTTAVVANHSAMDGATDLVTITYPITAKRANGDSISLNPVQSITKAKQGAQGSQGIQGSPGVDGADGASLYTWLKYADSPTTGMSDSPTGKTYMGIAYNKTSPTESTDYADYAWSLIQGEEGIPGTPGADGVTTYTWVKYADNASGGGMSDSPTGKTYIGLAFNKTTATESTNPGDYAWSLIQGAAGQNATAYWLITDVAAIAKSQSGAYIPAALAISAKSQTGTGAPGAYAGRFIIAETTDGSAWTDKYTSAANESSKAYTPTAGIKALRVRLYLAGGTATLLDEEVVPTVADSDVTPPGVPTSVSSSQLSTGALRVGFTGSTDSESGTGHYNIYRREQGSAAEGVVAQVLEDGSGSYIVDDTSPVVGKSYEFAVSAVDKRGNESAPSSWTAALASVVTDAPPNVAGAPTAKASSALMVVTWAVVNGAVAYRVERSTDSGSTWPTSFTAAANRLDDPIAAGVEIAALAAYRYRVKALSIYQALSAAWATSGAPDTTGYGTYVPAAPTVSYNVAKRSILAQITPQANLLNPDGWDVQIQRPTDGANWFCPNLAAKSDADPYYTGAAGGSLHLYEPSVKLNYLPIPTSGTPALPAEAGQGYYLRVRARCGSPATQSGWTASTILTVTPTLGIDFARAQVLPEILAAISKNKINSFINADDGTSGWTIGSGSTVEVVDSVRTLKLLAPNASFVSTPFEVLPDELLEFSFGLSCPNYSSLSGMFVGLTTADTYLRYRYIFAEKKWVYQDTAANRYFVSNYIHTTRKNFKTYILGNNVDISSVPAPETTDELYAIDCLKLSPGKTTASVRSGYNPILAGTYWYFYQPQIYRVGAGKVVAANIYALTLSAIQANLGVITAGKAYSVDYVAGVSGFAVDLDSGEIRSEADKWSITADGIFHKAGTIGVLDIAADKVSMGDGVYNDPATPFFVDDLGRLSLRNKVSIDENGNAHFGGANTTFEGNIVAEGGEFKGKLSTPVLDTTDPVDGSTLNAPAKTHYAGVSLINHCASLGLGTTLATGNYNGKTVSGVHRGDGSVLQNAFQSLVSEISDTLTDTDWHTSRSMVSVVTGKVKLSLYGKGFFTYHRILVNGAPVFTSGRINDMDYHAYSVTLDIAVGQTITTQWKGIDPPDYPIQKNFEILPISNTVGIKYSDNTFDVVDGAVYYDSPSGSVSPSGLGEWTTAFTHWSGAVFIALFIGKVAQNIAQLVDATSSVGGKTVESVYLNGAISILLHFTDDTEVTILAGGYYNYPVTDFIKLLTVSGSVRLHNKYHYKKETLGTYEFLVLYENTTELMRIGLSGGIGMLSEGIRSSGTRVMSVSAQRSAQVKTPSATKWLEYKTKKSGFFNIRTIVTIATSYGGTKYWRVYKNGAAFGTQRSTTVVSGTFDNSEDLEFSAGDLIQLYVWFSLNEYITWTAQMTIATNEEGWLPGYGG